MFARAHYFNWINTITLTNTNSRIIIYTSVPSFLLSVQLLMFSRNFYQYFLFVFKIKTWAMSSQFHFWFGCASALSRKISRHSDHHTCPARVPGCCLRPLCQSQLVQWRWSSLQRPQTRMCRHCNPTGHQLWHWCMYEWFCLALFFLSYRHILFQKNIAL